MGYTINLIQRVSDGNILGACGCSFIPINSQADYKNCLFIEGDPDDIPSVYNGFSPGDYRIMTFLVPGTYGRDYPNYQGDAFGTLADGPNANNANIYFSPDGRMFISSNFGVWATFVSNWQANGNPPAYVGFTSDQVSTYGIYGMSGREVRGCPEAYLDYTMFEIFELREYDGLYGGYIGNPDTINVVFFYT